MIIQHKKVFIYGAGMVGGLVLKRLIINEIAKEMISFVISEGKNGQTYMGYPVIDVHNLDGIKNAVIIVSTLKKNQSQIIKTLNEIGIKDFCIVDQELYKDMEKAYVEVYLRNHTLKFQNIDVLYMASDNNCSSGAFLCLVDLNRELNKKGISTLVVLPMYGDGEELLIKNNINYTYVLSEDWLGEIEEPLNSFENNEIAINKLVSFIRDFHIRLVHNNTTYTYIGAEAAKRTGIPYVWHIREFIREQGFWFCDENKSYSLINDAEVIIPVSHYVGNCYPGFNKEKINVVYDGVDIDKYLSSHKILKSNTVRILMPGNLIPLKGQKQLVEAALLLKKEGLDFAVSFVGSGDAEYIAELKEIVDNNSLGGHVFFFERTNELEEWYQKSDIVVVCSRSEAFGRVTVEAQLAGCLVIGAECGATQELIDNYSTGIFYKLNDPRDLAEKIDWVVRHSTEVRLITDRARVNAVQKFSKEKNAEKIFMIYRDILGSNIDGVCK